MITLEYCVTGWKPYFYCLDIIIILPLYLIGYKTQTMHPKLMKPGKTLEGHVPNNALQYGVHRSHDLATILH